MSSGFLRRVRIRNPVGWMDSDYVCLSVSCGQEYHEGTAFEAAVTLARTAGKPIIIDLSDTLQRYNLMAEGISESAAYVEARCAGDEWLERNHRAADGCTILRWCHWLTHVDYPAVRHDLSSLYAQDELFTATVNEDAERFLARRGKETAQMVACSRSFILEEAAGEILLAREYPCARLYPGRELETLRVLRTRLVPNAPGGLERTAYYRFTLETVRRPLAPQLRIA